MEQDDFQKNNSLIPNNNHVNVDAAPYRPIPVVDWSTLLSAYGQSQPISPELSPDTIEQQMRNMTLNSSSSFASSSRIIHNNNASNSRQIINPHYADYDQTISMFPGLPHSNIPYNRTQNPSFSHHHRDCAVYDPTIPYGLPHSNIPYYRTQNPSSANHHDWANYYQRTSMLPYGKPHNSIPYDRIAQNPSFDDHRRSVMVPPPRKGDLADKIDKMVNDQADCRNLQDKLNLFNYVERRMVFEASKSKLCDFAVRNFANYFVQKLIDVVELPELTQMVLIFTSRKQTLYYICVNDNGNKVMLKLVERLRWNIELQMLLMNSLSEIAVELTKSPNCKQLIDRCLEVFVHEPNELLLNEMANHCIEIAQDRSGCCILQKCFHQGINIQIFHRFVTSITQKALDLSRHDFGNYIVQFLIELGVSYVPELIAAELKGHFVSLSKNIHSSNVVEKLMKSDKNVANQIIYEMIEDPCRFLDVLQDQFGNFVGQTAVRVSESKRLEVYNDLKRIIENHAGQLKNHPCGRNVLRAIRNNKQNPARCNNNGRQ